MYESFIFYIIVGYFEENLGNVLELLAFWRDEEYTFSSPPTLVIRQSTWSSGLKRSVERVLDFLSIQPGSRLGLET